MRYIHRIFAAPLGERWDNRRLLAAFEPVLAELTLEAEERARLTEFVRFQLVGERCRYAAVGDWRQLTGFASRAAAFEEATERALDLLAGWILPEAERAGVRFDAILATTATGNLMPGIAYRLARRLGERVRPDTMLLDLSNVGCTGSSKCLNLARSLDAGYRHLLIVAVEVPSTLVDLRSTRPDVWQGNCTFGDGAAAAWLSNDAEAGPMALALEEIAYRQQAAAGFGLIRWGYRDYYCFELEDERTFDRAVREYVAEALRETEAGWKEEPRWAIHPAGIALLLRIARKLGIPQEAIQPSVRHYREFSNMSSASVLFILDELAREAPTGAAINLLTMGAGFNVVYGRVRRVR